MDGNVDVTPGYTAFSAAAKSAPPSGIVIDGADLGILIVDSGAFVEGIAVGAAGIVPRAGWDAGMLACDVTVSGMPGTEAPGTRGNENTSFGPGKLTGATHGSVLRPSGEFPVAATAEAPAADGMAARSAPAGGEVGGEVGGDAAIAGTPGKEYISAAGGIRGAAAQGPTFSPPADGDEGIGDGVAAAEASGMSGMVSASEAAMARKSASFNSPLGGDEGSCGAPGIDRGLGKAGTENISR